jgi:hypothetical protein
MGEEIEDVEFQETVADSKVAEPKASAVPKFFNPLSDEITTRDYNKKKDFGEAIDVPEPKINIAPEYEDEALAGKEVEQKEGMFDNVTNEKVNQLDGKEKKVAVSSLVDSILDGYEMLHGIAAQKAKIDENKFSQSIMEGDIDPELGLQTPEGSEITPPEMVSGYNENVDEMFRYDEDFNAKVKPPLERIFAKKGWGLTDEQFVGMQFAKDIGLKTIMFINLKKQGNQMMEQMAMMTQQMSRIQREQSAPVTPDTITKPAQQERQESKEEVTEVEEIENTLGGEEADE